MNRPRQPKPAGQVGAIQQLPLGRRGLGGERLGQVEQSANNVGRHNQREPGDGRHVADLGVPFEVVEDQPAAEPVEVGVRQRAGARPGRWIAAWSGEQGARVV